MNAKNDLKKAMAIWLLLCLGIHLLVRFSSLPYLRNFTLFITAFLLLYLPSLLWKKVPDFVFYFEKNRGQIFYSLKILAIFSALVFPLFFVANHYFQELVFKAKFHPYLNWADSRIWLIFLNHLLLIALPEEYFFRGFLLEKMQNAYPPSEGSFTIGGVPLSGFFFLNALVFAFSHSLIVLQWWHFAIFFPGLAFTWLRLKTKGMIAPMVFHALCNVANFWIAQSY